MYNNLNAIQEFLMKKALPICCNEFGKNGIKHSESIDISIPWRPTFYIKNAIGHGIVAFEVDDVIYPSVFKDLAFPILQHNSPISIYQVCTFEGYIKPSNRALVKELKNHGFGIITVDDDGTVEFQQRCIPISQYLPEGKFKELLTGLPNKIKLLLNNSYRVYVTDGIAGVHKASNIVEKCIRAIAKWAVINHGLSASHDNKNKPIAVIIDALFTLNALKNYRAELGAARSYMKHQRNPSGHDQHTRKELILLLGRCRDDFTASIDTVQKLTRVIKALKVQMPAS